MRPSSNWRRTSRSAHFIDQAPRAPIPNCRCATGGDRLPDGGDAYLAGLRALNATANRTTGIFQKGSLPIYTAVILLTAVTLPVATLLADVPWPGWPDAATDPGHLLVATARGRRQRGRRGTTTTTPAIRGVEGIVCLSAWTCRKPRCPPASR